MSEHTPGPRIIKRFDESQIVVLGPDDGDGRRELIATFTGEHRLENAALDAAGPELLAVCEALLEAARQPAIGPALCDAYIENMEALVPRLEAAIAEAKQASG